MKSKLLPALGFTILLFSQQLFAQNDKTIDEKLSIISTLTVNDKYLDIPADSILRKYLKVEWISEEEFLAKQKTKTSYLVADTTKYRKKKGVLRLPTGIGTRTFTDKIEEGESYKQYDYSGQIAFLNSYVVRTMFWEDISYDLVSKKDGAKTETFSAMPIVSPGKKKLVTVFADPYDIYTQVSVYSILNGKFKNILTVSFENWMPGAEDLIFWGVDGKLYLPFQPSDKFWKENGDLDTDYQYMRITLL